MIACMMPMFAISASAAAPEITTRATLSWDIVLPKWFLPSSDSVPTAYCRRVFWGEYLTGSSVFAIIEESGVTISDQGVFATSDDLLSVLKTKQAERNLR
jgi:hypothetical protein